MTKEDLGPTWRWLVGLLLLALGSLLTLGVRDMVLDVATATATNVTQDKDIAALKSNAEARGRQLDRIEIKIDKLMERR